jgi:SAM-dependent methyltransferase
MVWKPCKKPGHYERMFEFHHDRRRYFDIQVENSRKSIVPFIHKYGALPSNAKILEVGCGEGGVLKAFIEAGYTGVGVEIEQERLGNGRLWLADEINQQKLQLLASDIFDVSMEKLKGPFDLVILKDVIEHIGDKDELLQKLKALLAPGGMLFIGFPPWQMPFGGHQQLCSNKLLGKTPWLHLLPRFVYRQVLIRFRQPVDELLGIRDCRISIEGFNKLVRRTGYACIAKEHFLIAPIYQYKFGWRERKQWRVVRKIPVVRNLVTTAVYYLIRPQEINGRVSVEA